MAPLNIILGVMQDSLGLFDTPALIGVLEAGGVEGCTNYSNHMWSRILLHPVGLERPRLYEATR